MNFGHNLLRILLLLLVSLQLVACSRTVQWEEEVPLNTGGTIWVKRTITYARSSAYANPLELGWKLESETLAFEFDKKQYEWKGDASPLLLAISSQRQPTLVANAADFYRWGDRHSYKCVKPYYVQFSQQAGGSWIWPSTIEPWLYGIPTNLMGFTTDPDAMPRRVTSADREKFDVYALKNLPEYKQIVSTYLPDFCQGKV